MYFAFSPQTLQIWNHPDVLYEALQKENQANEQDLDLDDITSASNPRCPAPSTGLKTKVADASNSKHNTLPPINPTQDRANQVITYEWVCPVAMLLLQTSFSSLMSVENPSFLQSLNSSFSYFFCLRQRTSCQTTKQEFWRTLQRWFSSSI